MAIGGQSAWAWTQAGLSLSYLALGAPHPMPAWQAVPGKWPSPQEEAAVDM